MRDKPMDEEDPPIDYQLRVDALTGGNTPGSPYSGFYTEMGRSLSVLRWSGLFPSTFRRRESQSPCSRFPFTSMLVWILSLGSLFGNVALVSFNCYIIVLMRRVLGILHPDTMTQLLTGFKPVQTTMNILLFLGGLNRHKAMLRSLASSEALMRGRLGVRPPYKRYASELTLLTGLIALAVFLLRFAQYVLSEEVPGALWLADASLLFVPALSIIQLVPLFYFILINRLLRFWFSSLTVALRADIQLRRHRIDFYYSLYLRLCASVTEMGRFFNPFIFLSLAVSVMVLCLTIYFFVNANEIFTIPDDLQSTQATIVMAFLPFWAGMQIVTAGVYAVSVAVTGIQTNETSREIMGVLLILFPNDEISRFQMMLFTTKVQTQHTWGVTVWRAFPVERGLIITMVSAIVTYTVVLIKLQQSAATVDSDQASAFGLLFNGTFSDS